MYCYWHCCSVTVTAAALLSLLRRYCHCCAVTATAAPLLSQLHGHQSTHSHQSTNCHSTGRGSLFRGVRATYVLQVRVMDASGQSITSFQLRKKLENTYAMHKQMNVFLFGMCHIHLKLTISVLMWTLDNATREELYTELKLLQSEIYENVFHPEADITERKGGNSSAIVIAMLVNTVSLQNQVTAGIEQHGPWYRNTCVKNTCGYVTLQHVYSFGCWKRSSYNRVYLSNKGRQYV